MNFENPTNRQEKAPVSMTREQFDKIRNTFVDDMNSESFVVELEELGIELNSGDIDVIVDGETMRITTAEHDFGTVLESPDTPLA